MSITTITSREFNHDAAAAKRAAKVGPVHITNRGQLEAVLLSAEEYRRLKNKKLSILDLIKNPAVADIELDLSDTDQLAEAPDLSGLV